MKKLVASRIDLFLMSVFILCFSGLQAQEAPSTTVEIKAPVVEVCYNASNSYTATVTTKNFTAMRSFDLTLTFDRTEFVYASVTGINHSLGGTWVAPTVDLSDPLIGKVRFRWTNANSVSIWDPAYANLFQVNFNVVNFPNNSGDNQFDSPLTWEETVSKFYNGENYTGNYAVNTTAFVNGSLNVAVAYSAIQYTIAPDQCDVATIEITSPVGTGMNYYLNGSTIPSTTGQFTALVPSTITVRMKDANGCYSHLVNIPVGSPDPLAFAVSAESPDCNGDHGEIQFDVSGGTGPYTYFVVPTEEFEAFQSQLTIQGLVTTAPYFAPYKSSNFQVLRPVGIYRLAVSDANGCVDLSNVNNWKTTTITEPAPIAFSVQLTDASPGVEGQTGSISISSVSGGTAPYSFVVANAGTAVPVDGWTAAPGTISGLTPNYYSVWVKDAKDCMVGFDNPDGTGNVLSIQSPMEQSLSAIVTLNKEVTCHGGSNGKFTVTAAGGVPPYKYAAKKSALPALVSAPDINSEEWQTSNIFDKATAGTWIIWVKDNNGSMVGGEGTTNPVNVWRVRINEPNTITFTGTVSTTDVTAIGVADGSITVPLEGVKGGKPEFDGSGDYTFTLTKPTGTTFTNTTGIFTGLAVGTYSVTIRDEAGCAGATLTATITNPDLPAGTKQLNISAGTLSTVLTATEKATITHLTLTGTIDAQDFKTMRDDMYLLSVLDLSQSFIVEYIGTQGTIGTNNTIYPAHTVPDNAFCNPTSGVYKTTLTSVILPEAETAIGNLAFRKCENLTSIILPSSVPTIGTHAFQYCRKLTSINIPSPVPSIKQATFGYCTELRSVTIPSSVTTIEHGAFFYCSSLTSLAIPSSVNSIMYEALQACTSLKSLTVFRSIPVDLSSSQFVFFGVDKSSCILHVPFGSKAAYQVADQWKDFTNIIELPGFTLSKSEIVFNPTIDKTTVELTITNGTAWQTSSDADWLKVNPTGNDNSAVLVVEATENTSSNIRTGKITVTATNAEPKTITVTQAGQEQVLDLTIHVQTPGTLSALLSAAQKSSVKRLTVTGVIDARDFKTMRDDLHLLEFLDLSGVTIAAYTGTQGTAGTDVMSYPANAIPDYAFCKPDTLVGKTTLVSFHFPPTVTIIKNTAFGGCTGLSNLTIPSTVTTIERNTFIGCTDLSGNLNIPSLVTFVGSGAFNGCIQLTVVTVPASLVTIEPNAFDSHALIHVSAQNPNYSSIEGVFVNKDQTTLIQFPKVKTGTYRIPSTIINIGKDAFIDCTQLDGVIIPLSVKTIGDESFKGCTNLKGIIFPNSLTSIGFRAFYNCTGLKTFSLQTSVTSIGSEAFRNCAGLESIYANSPLPIDLSNSPSVFEGVNKTTCLLYVPYGSKAAYQAADQWKDFLNIIEMPGLNLSTNSVRLAGAQGSSVTVDLSSNTQWHISTTATWLNISPSWGEGTRKLTITADANSNQIRDAAIALYISGSTTPSQIISVVQDTDAGSISGFDITIPNQEHNLGLQMEVPVYTSQLDANSNIISYQFNLDYDQTKLQYVDHSFSGTIAEGGSVVVNAITPGRLQISYMRSMPISGVGALIKLKFNTLATGTSDITISDFFYNSTPCPLINNGKVTINDNTPPTAVIAYSDWDGLVKPGDKLTITATFNEPMAESPVPQIILGGANNLRATNMTKVSNAIYTFEHTVANGNGDVHVSLASGTDLSGNLVTEMPTSGRIFWIDNLSPQVLLTFSDTDLKVRAGDEMVITATFSEALAGSSVPGISLSGANTRAPTAMTKVSSTVYTYKYTVLNGDGLVSVHLSGATDIAGNLVVSPTSGNTFQIIRFRFGDVDDNGYVQAYDAALALQYSVRLDPLPAIDPLPWEKWRIMAADVDNSVGVTANDAAMILQYSANLIAVFPSENRIKSGRIDEVDVYVSIENGSLAFRSNGNMIGLNLSVRENRQLLGMPQLVDPNMILATNISETTYAVGIATAIAPGNGEVFMKIPYNGGSNSKVILEMIVNTSVKELIVGLATSRTEFGGNKILVYPNPALHALFIKGLDGESKGSIYDLQGKFIFEQNVVNGQIDIRNLKMGLYILKIGTADRVETTKFEKR